METNLTLFQSIQVFLKAQSSDQFFLLYINDLPGGIKSKVRLFADDTMYSKRISNECSKKI